MKVHITQTPIGPSKLWDDLTAHKVSAIIACHIHLQGEIHQLPDGTPVTQEWLLDRIITGIQQATGWEIVIN